MRSPKTGAQVERQSTQPWYGRAGSSGQKRTRKRSRSGSKDVMVTSWLFDRLSNFQIEWFQRAWTQPKADGATDPYQAVPDDFVTDSNVAPSQLSFEFCESSRAPALMSRKGEAPEIGWGPPRFPRLQLPETVRPARQTVYTTRNLETRTRPETPFSRSTDIDLPRIAARQ
jgi:hypothetical protein